MIVSKLKALLEAIIEMINKRYNLYVENVLNVIKKYI